MESTNHYVQASILLIYFLLGVILASPDDSADGSTLSAQKHTDRVEQSVMFTYVKATIYLVIGVAVFKGFPILKSLAIIVYSGILITGYMAMLAVIKLVSLLWWWWYN
ncbi:hypothetical protein BX661DRAFT_176714 [Kickxella alabastrina]|uniref:uncharacterized protein n=1 Tax=Kickxella alabastrina TaxID=61397 RepID=UPI00221F84E3|nr:uncharacterized protein BX661DRAFT_176714 [Kickxella alabastrina]KAI7834151.1 hypothetical protein BX661DRAFT_176714 [Kickxella alabastrina]